MTQSITHGPESQEWPEIVTRRQQERPSDSVRDPKKVVGRNQGVAWEPRKVKATRGGTAIASRISNEQVLTALDNASKMELEYVVDR